MLFGSLSWLMGNVRGSRPSRRQWLALLLFPSVDQGSKPGRVGTDLRSNTETSVNQGLQSYRIVSAEAAIVIASPPPLGRLISSRVC